MYDSEENYVEQSSKEQDEGHFHCPDVASYSRARQGYSRQFSFLTTTGEPAEMGTVECRERLGGLLKFYYREAA